MKHNSSHHTGKALDVYRTQGGEVTIVIEEPEWHFITVSPESWAEIVKRVGA